MLTRHHYIKNIENIIKEKLEELELEILLEPSQFIKENKRFYSAPCIDKNREKVFFKILIVDELAASEAIKREIEVRKFLANFKDKINYPLLIKSDSKNFPYWFVSQYFEGKLLGHFYNLYLNDKKYISFLVDVLFSLQKIPKTSIKKAYQIKDFYLWERNFNQYVKLIKEYQVGINKKISKEIEFREIYNLLKKEGKNLAKSPLVFAHGDFTLANFVVSGEKIIITDWEQAHLDNVLYDLSHLWIQLWRYPDWQKKLISEFLDRVPKKRLKEFQNLFRLMVITEALGELRWSINLCEKKYKNGATKAALKTINAALKGFRNLS